MLGVYQEGKAEKSLEALKELAAPTCKVIRDGVLKVVNSIEVTLGDLIVLEAGDRIPADGTFVEASGMMVDESLLTGESVGVSNVENNTNITNNAINASLNKNMIISNNKFTTIQQDIK